MIVIWQPHQRIPLAARHFRGRPFSAPFVVIRALGCRHPGAVKAPLEGRPCLCGNLLHGNVYDPARSWADAGDSGTTVWRVAS